MRTFISLELPEEIKDEIVLFQNELQKARLFEGKMTERENLHLTLKFLGEISEETADKIKKKLENIKFKKFSAEISGAGTFSENFVRIIWVALNGKELFKIQEQIDDELKELFNEGERFMAHVTIARPKKIFDRKKLMEFLGEDNFNGKKYLIDKISFKKSELTKQGPVYENLLVIEGK